MKFKKLVSITLCSLLSLSFFACGREVKREQNTVNIMMVQSGYGTSYMEDVKAKFEKLYANEGYKINILEPRASFTGKAALTDIRMGVKNGYDIVISGGFTVQELTDPEYGTFIEPLNDVFDSYTINFDGSLDDKKIAELYDSSQDWRCKIGDTYWGVPYTTSPRGLVCNIKVLEDYGIDSLPITTNELFNDFNIIYKGNNNIEGTNPIVWGGDNAYGYALPPLYTAIAQLMGVEEYNKFFKMDYLLNSDGTIKADGYNFINDERIRYAIKTVAHEFDLAFSYGASLTQTHTSAHMDIACGDTAFMFDGSFFFNEIKIDCADYLHDVRFIHLPIVSELGVMLKLDGTGNDAAKCDKILSYMAKLVDKGTTAEEIKSLTNAEFSISLTDEQVNRVVEARQIGNGNDNYIHIMKDSPNVEIAKTFVRFLLSKDSAGIFATYGMLPSLYSDAEVDTEYQFIKDCYKAQSIYTYLTTSSLYPYTVRLNTNMFLLPTFNAKFPITISSSLYMDNENVKDPTKERNYDEISRTIFNKMVKDTRENWEKLVAIGGYKIG